MARENMFKDLYFYSEHSVCTRNWRMVMFLCNIGFTWAMIILWIYFSEFYKYLKTYIIFIFQNRRTFFSASKGTIENFQLKVANKSFPYCSCPNIFSLLWQYFQILKNTGTYLIFHYFITIQFYKVCIYVHSQHSFMCSVVWK